MQCATIPVLICADYQLLLRSQNQFGGSVFLGMVDNVGPVLTLFNISFMLLSSGVECSAHLTNVTPGVIYAVDSIDEHSYI